MPRTREDMLAGLKANPKVEVVIIGGGINGVSAFRELALQGVRALLVDRGDFCSGCSSAPSRMIHGGLRYLENGEISLVRESLRERDALLRNAPHMVRPLPTTVPIHHAFSGLLNGALGVMRLRTRPAERGALAVKIGLSLYDLLSRERRAMPRHVFRSRKQTQELWPDLPETVQYSATYHDAWISHPERLGVELVLDGLAANPESLAINHLGVTGRDGRTLTLTDALTGESLSVEAELIVNATGAWVDQTNAALFPSAGRPAPFVGGTKGSHLILDHPELLRALNGHMIYFENVDGRVCILFPYLGRVLLGSTDIRVDAPDNVRCEDDEVGYILNSLANVFPAIEVRPEHIVYRYSGVRPLPHSNASFTGSISRDHFVATVEGDPKVLCLIGGKWTTFRAFGEQAADKVLALLSRERRVQTVDRPIGGGAGFPAEAAGQDAFIAELACRFAVSQARAAHAVDHYGSRAGDVLAFCANAPDEPLAGSCTTANELRYLIHREFARSPADLLQRRTSLAITGVLSSGTISRASAILADELGWDDAKQLTEETAFRAMLASDHGLSPQLLDQRDTKMGSPACA
jgi:glycerol-3-phosphate dehydrogenase